jgi:hypothetical protein
MKKQNQNKRKKIEIYFILYLAALVMLIPDAADKDTISPEESDNISTNLPFMLKPQKFSLNAVFMRDSSGIRQITFDSTNRIYYSGNPDKVDFEILIEDLINVRQLNLDNNSQYFQTFHNKKEQFIDFLWKPPINDYVNQSFNVIIKADFYSNDRAINKRTEFTLNKSYISSGEYLYVDNNSDTVDILERLRSSVLNDNLINFSTSEINLIPMEYNIKTVAYSSWKNVINITGLNPERELLKNPEIEVIHNPQGNGGNALISGIESNRIIISGKAPEYGSISVILKLTRASDSREATVQFGVLPQPIGMPEIPKKIYPYQTYEFNPNLPILTNQTTGSALKDSEGNILVDSQSGGAFVFTPNERLAGKTLFFERYIDDELFGQKYEIDVSNYPTPSFSRVQKINNKKIRVFTKSYGLFNGEENYIKEIMIEGNAEYTEIIGQARFDKNEFVYTQVFEFELKDEDKPFAFSAVAVNRKNEKSNKLIYPQN